MLTLKNQYTYLRRELAARVLSLFYAGNLKAEIDAVPIQMLPKDMLHSRCCIYKDRAMIRYRLMSLLGVDIETQDNELKSLAAYAEEAVSGEIPVEPLLTTIAPGCSSCVQGQYRVTDLCRGCLARPCQTNCPKNAICFIEGRAVIDTKNCVNCGKCKDVCPFNAIVYIPVPCEEACPVNAITKNSSGFVEIDRELCIDCGKCTRSCPFGAIVERSRILEVAKALTSDRVCQVLIAPSIAGQFPGSFTQLLTALRKMGFDQIFEVADGAAQTARNEALELLALMQEKAAAPLEASRYMTTSCCPAYTGFAKTHAPHMIGHISHTPSPLWFSAQQAKEADPEAFRVFIGPCIAKKREGSVYPEIDAVLTYEELGAFFRALSIDVQELKVAEEFSSHTASVYQKFAVSSGVGASVLSSYAELGEDYAGAMGRQGCSCGELSAAVEPVLPEVIQIDGIDRKQVRLMKSWSKRPPQADLVEVMCCEGGCVAGPGTIVQPAIAKKALLAGQL